MLRKIKLYGQLAKYIGQRVLEADVASAAEAVRFLVVNFPELEQHMAKQHYQVRVGTYGLTLDELHDPAGTNEIKIIPVIAGAGGNAGLTILAGAALIALSFVSFGAGAWAGIGGWGGVAGSASTAVFGIGASLVLGGIAQLLSPVPKVQQGLGGDNDPRKTYSFSGIQQTSRQGIAVPIVYGKTITGSVVISAGIDTVQVKA